MHIATVVLSVLLAVEFAFTGLIKILGTATAAPMPSIWELACGSAALSVSPNWPLWWDCWPESRSSLLPS